KWQVKLNVNGAAREFLANHGELLIYALREHLNITAPCGLRTPRLGPHGALNGNVREILHHVRGAGHWRRSSRRLRARQSRQPMHVRRKLSASISWSANALPVPPGIDHSSSKLLEENPIRPKKRSGLAWREISAACTGYQTS
ncbi:UNVERIFIED_CONTAM: hypothetical protein GTU68_055869, partial [Idotea baltica]|nr:hypothetical protein [Idotea baltica]